MLEEYHKIETMFERDHKTKKLIEDKFINEELEYLKDLAWQFTEKIDGTNTRIYWDGNKVSFFGKSNDSAIPSGLVNRLVELFGGEKNEQLFEQKFGKTQIILFGEGYGKNIQTGGSYKDTQDFILFDVMISGNFQPRESIENIAEYFGIDVVPIVLEGTLKDGIEFVKTNPKSTIGTAQMEGVVGRPKVELKSRTGDRIIVKIKSRDFD